MRKSVNQTLEFLYNSYQIHFLLNPEDDNVMVNATEMAKLFNKRVDDFTRLLSTKDFIKVILNDLNSTNNHAHVRDYNENDVISSSKKRGTYMHEVLALEFATWLNPEFKLWIYKTIKEIVTKKNAPVKNIVAVLENKKQKLKSLLEKANKEENTVAIDILELNKEIERLKRNKSKILQRFANQYEMDL